MITCAWGCKPFQGTASNLDEEDNPISASPNDRSNSQSSGGGGTSGDVIPDNSPNNIVLPDVVIDSSLPGYTYSSSLQISFYSPNLFSANDPTPKIPKVSRFKCQLDGKSYYNCSSPTTVSNLQIGSHVFRVIPVLTNGKPGQIAEVSWMVLPPSPIDPLPSPTPSASPLPSPSPSSSSSTPLPTPSPSFSSIVSSNQFFATWVKPAPIVEGNTSLIQYQKVAIDPKDQSVYVAVSNSYYGNNASSNLVLIKYNSSGDVVWSKSIAVVAETYSAQFNSIAVDDSSNVYVVGSTAGFLSFDFGNGVSVSTNGAGSVSNNPLVAKFDSTGKAVWAKTVTSGSGIGTFYHVSIAKDGSVYCVGNMSAESFGFGNNVTASKSSSALTTALLVKYNNAGTPQWAKTISGVDVYDTSYVSVSVTEDGSVYTAGYLLAKSNPNTFDFGNAVQLSITNPAWYRNFVLVKYNSDGQAQWAKTATGSEVWQIDALALATSKSGDVYVGGYLHSNLRYEFGNSISVKVNYTCDNGMYYCTSAESLKSFKNLFIVKYNSTGTAQWAKTVGALGTSYDGSRINSLSISEDGSIYGSGIFSNQKYELENNVNVDLRNYKTTTVPMLIKYSPNGQTLGQTAVNSSDYSSNKLDFKDVALINKSSIYVIGNILGNYQEKSLQLSFGNSLFFPYTVSESSNLVPYLIKYEEK